MRLGHDLLWKAGLDAQGHGGSGKKMGKKEFDKLLAGYTVRFSIFLLRPGTSSLIRNTALSPAKAVGMLPLCASLI